MACLVRCLLEIAGIAAILRRQFLGNQRLAELLEPPAIEKTPPSLPLEEVSTGGGGSEPDFSNEPHTDFSTASSTSSGTARWQAAVLGRRRPRRTGWRSWRRPPTCCASAGSSWPRWKA